jgi:hypothetical protein
MTNAKWSAIVLSAAALLGLGCGDAEVPSDLATDLRSDELGEVGKPDGDGFEAIVDDVSDRATTPAYRIFTTAASYARYFGHSPPSAIDWSTEWVAYYSAGVQSSGGFEASFTLIGSYPALWPETLVLSTNLAAPGDGCFVTAALTPAYALVKFRRPTERVRIARIYRSTSVVSCEETPCGNTTCGQGYYCCDPLHEICAPVGGACTH